MIRAISRLCGCSSRSLFLSARVSIIIRINPTAIQRVQLTFRVVRPLLRKEGSTINSFGKAAFRAHCNARDASCMPNKLSSRACVDALDFRSPCLIRIISGVGCFNLRNNTAILRDQVSEIIQFHCTEKVGLGFFGYMRRSFATFPSS